MAGPGVGREATPGNPWRLRPFNPIPVEMMWLPFPGDLVSTVLENVLLCSTGLYARRSSGFQEILIEPRTVSADSSARLVCPCPNREGTMGPRRIRMLRGRSRTRRVRGGWGGQLPPQAASDFTADRLRAEGLHALKSHLTRA